MEEKNILDTQNKVRVAMPDAPSLMTLYGALNQCYNDIEIEVDEDVEDMVP